MLLQTCFKYSELNSLCRPALVQKVATDAALQPGPSGGAATAAKQPLHMCLKTLTGSHATVKILCWHILQARHKLQHSLGAGPAK